MDVHSPRLDAARQSHALCSLSMPGSISTKASSRKQGKRRGGSKGGRPRLIAGQAHWRGTAMRGAAGSESAAEGASHVGEEVAQEPISSASDGQCLVQQQGVQPLTAIEEPIARQEHASRLVPLRSLAVACCITHDQSARAYLIHGSAAWRPAEPPQRPPPQLRAALPTGQAGPPASAGLVGRGAAAWPRCGCTGRQIGRAHV